MKRFFILNFLISLTAIQACTQNTQKNKEAVIDPPSNINLSDDFGDHWYQGKAELTSYDLEQVRYGEIRQGHAVLVFVTEDFSKRKQVKLDNPSASPDDALKVLKLNFTKKFNTGIYPYSMMSSVFSPVYPDENLHAVKITTSVQEWCGHVFMQFNRQANEYAAITRSYFESEGDQDFTLPMVFLEDELWNLIRLDPNAIPMGKVEMVPSTMYLRLKHQETKAYSATIDKIDTGLTTTLTINYPELRRTVAITYEKTSPYRINSWDETYPEGGTMMTTSGKLRERIWTDYWTKNSEADSVFREKLGLD